jgi:type III secretion system YscD/HrpQ family protein
MTLTPTPPRATLTVDSGLHCGATLELTSEAYLVGSADDCDIVLRDAPVAPHHCRIVRDWSGLSVRDVRTDTSGAVAPKDVSYHEGAIGAEYDVGGVLFTLRQMPPGRSPGEPGNGPTRPAALVLLCAVSVAVLLSVLTLTLTRVGRADEHSPVAIDERIVAGNRALATHGFTSARFRRGAQGGLEVTGLVADLAQKQSLTRLLGHESSGGPRVNVQVASEILEQARRAIADERLQVDLREGRLRIAGTTSALAVKERIRALTADLQSTVPVEDHTQYVDRDLESPGPLPVRLSGVMLGNPSYFLTDSGDRYFVGGVLPDGAEVVAIDASQIRFRRGASVIVYSLQ